MGDTDDTYRSKVDRLITEHELEGLGDELERRWTREEDRDSLRDLAEYFNRQLLERAVETSRLEPIEGEIDNIYRILREDGVSSGVRQETKNRLSQHGIDVESLEADFVTYQAVRTYLQNYRNVESPDTTPDARSHRESKQSTVQQLTGRLRTITTDALTELKKAGHLTLGEFEVIVSVNVHCTDCGLRLSVTELFREGGCQCDPER
jgi:hypothetical protein